MSSMPLTLVDELSATLVLEWRSRFEHFLESDQSLMAVLAPTVAVRLDAAQWFFDSAKKWSWHPHLAKIEKLESIDFTSAHRAHSSPGNKRNPACVLPSSQTNASPCIVCFLEGRVWQDASRALQETHAALLCDYLESMEPALAGRPRKLCLLMAPADLAAVPQVLATRIELAARAPF